MGTAYSSIYEVFLSGITDYSLVSYTSTQLATLELSYLKRAINKFIDCKQDLTDRSDTTSLFNITLTVLEIEILGNMMIVEWLNPQIRTTNLIKQAMGDKDFKISSQANHLEKLLVLKKDIKKDIKELKNDYKYGLSTNDDLS